MKERLFKDQQRRRDWWGGKWQQFVSNLATYASPYTVIVTYFAVIGTTQVLTASENGYLTYWDTLMTPMELRWLIPITFGFPLGFFGFWFAHHRSEQTKKQIDL